MVFPTKLKYWINRRIPYFGILMLLDIAMGIALLFATFVFEKQGFQKWARIAFFGKAFSLRFWASGFDVKELASD